MACSLARHVGRGTQSYPVDKIHSNSGQASTNADSKENSSGGLTSQSEVALDYGSRLITVDTNNLVPATGRH